LFWSSSSIYIGLRSSEQDKVTTNLREKVGSGKKIDCVVAVVE
jgi:hypothetical protein